MSRIDELLGHLAEAFDDGRTFDGYFLQEHNVRADDCLALEKRLAAVLRGYLAAPKDYQNLILAAGVMHDVDPGIMESLWFTGVRDLSMREATKRLKAMKP